LDTVYIDFAFLRTSIFYKTDGIVKYAFDLLSYVVFQVIFLVLDVLIKIVSTIVSSTVDNMCDTIFVQDLLILSNKVTTKV
jgi:hypothetical protein